MSSSDRRAILSFALLALAGCGFSPALAPGGSTEGLNGQIAIDPPAAVESFEFVRALEARLGRPEAARYRLSADIEIAEEGMGILPDQTITRYSVLGRVEYTLTEIATGRLVTSGEVSNFTSYAATSTTVATSSAQVDARRRLMTILADQVVDDLYLSRRDWAA
jgi:LPS-assembly lipoprotein